MNSSGVLLPALLSLLDLSVALPLWAEAEVAPPEIRFVPEMESVPELDKWPQVEGSAHEDDLRQMKVEWKKIMADVQRKLTVAQVIALSKWAKPQMQNYTVLPSLDQPDFELRAALAQEKKLLFEATLQVLPSHSPIVTRWLKLLVVYDQERRTIRQVIITIRGEAQE